MDQTIADAALSSDEDEQLPVDNLAVGYQLLADRPGDASPDSVAEPSVAEMHSGTSSSNASDCDEGTSSPFNDQAVAGGRAGGSGSLVDTKDSNDNSASDGTGNQRNKGSKPSALSEGQRVAVLQAMQTVQLDYRPAWADVVPEESWVQRLNELREALQGGV
ncbi:hypothetical protein N2152v2_000366 [Parachlorella kessleri]